MNKSGKKKSSLVPTIPLTCVDLQEIEHFGSSKEKREEGGGGNGVTRVNKTDSIPRKGKKKGQILSELFL